MFVTALQLPAKLISNLFESENGSMFSTFESHRMVKEHDRAFVFPTFKTKSNLKAKHLCSATVSLETFHRWFGGSCVQTRKLTCPQCQHKTASPRLFACFHHLCWIYPSEIERNMFKIALSSQHLHQFAWECWKILRFQKEDQMFLSWNKSAWFPL